QIKFSVAQMHDLRYAADIAGCLFHAYNGIYIFYKVCQSFRLNGTTGAAWHVIKNRWKRRFCADFCIVCYESVLGGFVVVRGYKEQSVRAVLHGILRELDCRCSAVGACSCDDWD